MAALKLLPDPYICGPDDEGDDELVVCFVSGRRVPKRAAVLVRIGPGHKVWMLPEFCGDGGEGEATAARA
ncbi:MAG: hypothetical protein CSA66_07560 [Proteobacteria bacterium]|nr:MAG: hypothetical protein CSA66_07560 [Pseudomonadota bacterium]